MLRFYSDEDYEPLVQILKEADMYDKTWESRDNLKRKIKKDPESIIIAEEKEIIGCIFLMDDGWNAFLWRLAVKKSHRKKGIGKELVKKAEEIIESRGMKEISFFVDINNGKLQNWYEKQDYKKGRDWTFMYKELK